MEKNQDFNGRIYETRFELVADEVVYVRFATEKPAMLKVRAKGSGVSALVEYTTSPMAMLDLGTADFDPSPIGENGLVIDKVLGTEIIAPLNALRVTAMGGPVVVEVTQ